MIYFLDFTIAKQANRAEVIGLFTKSNIFKDVYFLEDKDGQIESAVSYSDDLQEALKLTANINGVYRLMAYQSFRDDDCLIFAKMGSNIWTIE